jgi:peroxiredoxin Q/BCP
VKFAFGLLLCAAWAVGCRRDSSGTPPNSLSELQNQAAPAPTTPLTPGTEVFDFVALAHNGQRFKLSHFLDKPVGVYFCPQDETPTCTALAASIRDAWLPLNTHLSMVFGISTEDSVTHRDFASENRLPYLMVADVEQGVHRAMGVQPGTVVSFIIAKDRRVQHVFAPPTIASHGKQILDALTSPLTPPSASSAAQIDVPPSAALNPTSGTPESLDPVESEVEFEE